MRTRNCQENCHFEGFPFDDLRPRAEPSGRKPAGDSVYAMQSSGEYEVFIGSQLCKAI